MSKTPRRRAAASRRRAAVGSRKIAAANRRLGHRSTALRRRDPNRMPRRVRPAVPGVPSAGPPTPAARRLSAPAARSPSDRAAPPEAADRSTAARCSATTTQAGRFRRRAASFGAETPRATPCTASAVASSHKVARRPPRARRAATLARVRSHATTTAIARAGNFAASPPRAHWEACKRSAATAAR